MTEVLDAPSESEHFGVRIGRAQVRDDDDVMGLPAAALARGIELLVVRCDVRAPAAARDLAGSGYDLMDTVIHYGYDLARALPEASTSSNVRPATPGDAEGVEEVARVAFHDHRGHFQADDRLDATARRSLYPMWARASCLAADDPGDVVLVAEEDDRVVGFVTGRVPSGSEPVGLLAGVLPEHRRSGLYRALLVRRLEEFRATGAARTVVGTQLAHLPSQRAWLGLGYEPVGAEHTFHRWFAAS